MKSLKFFVVASIFLSLTIGCDSLRGTAKSWNPSRQTGGPSDTTETEKRKVKLFTLEVNVGPIPVEQYLDMNGTLIAGCDPKKRVRECLKENMKNYVQQGVTVLRYMFDMSQTAFLASGAVNPTYVSNLNLIHQDFKASGITGIIPTPNWDGWGGEVKRTVFDPCQNKEVEFYFFRTSPLPFDTTLKYPYDFAGDQTYHCAPANPIFVGWDNIYSLLDKVILSAKDNNLEIPQFDIRNEVNLHWFAVMARMVYDVHHHQTGDPNVYMSIRKLMSKHGYSAGNVNYSTVASNVSSTNFNCMDPYGSSGRLISQSALAAAIAGEPFGRGSDWDVQNRIVCGGNKKGMAQLPVASPLPDIFDIHDYHCIDLPEGGCDITKSNQIESDVVVFYDSLANFLKRIGKPRAQLAIGETHSLIYQRPNVSCEAIAVPSSASTQMISGMTKSLLSTSVGRSADSNILRPWNYIMDASDCYTIYHDLSGYQNSVLVPMGPPTITNVGSGCNGCDCAWVTGSNFYPDVMQVHLRKANWDLLGISEQVSVSSDQSSMSLTIPQQYQSEFASGGLRLTVLNTENNTWETSDVARCQ